jgi:hypothetical protein
VRGKDVSGAGFKPVGVGSSTIELACDKNPQAEAYATEAQPLFEHKQSVNYSNMG